MANALVLAEGMQGIVGSLIKLADVRLERSELARFDPVELAADAASGRGGLFQGKNLKPKTGMGCSKTRCSVQLGDFNALLHFLLGILISGWAGTAAFLRLSIRVHCWRDAGGQVFDHFPKRFGGLEQ